MPRTTGRKTKKDIRKMNFRSIVGWRGDSLCCPQAFGGDVFSGCSLGCWWCFCREMEASLFNHYYSGYSRDLVRACHVDDYKKLFDQAYGSDKPTKNWNIKCLRHGLPFNMGSKAETFCFEDLEENVVVPVLELFREYKVPIIFETKSPYVGLTRYLDIIKDLHCAVIISIMGGSDTLNYELEPGCAAASARWYVVDQLNKKGIWTGVRWEPIMAGINDRREIFEGYAQNAKKYGAKHVSFYNYRSSNYRMAKVEFEKRGYNFIRMLENNLDEKWRPKGKLFSKIMKEAGVPASSPDFVNFPFDNSCESCCGVDGLFTPYHFTFQHACTLIKENGQVSWDDMEEIDFREPKSYERMKACWNGKGHYFNLNDSPDIIVLDKDKKGRNIYGSKTGDKKPKKQGFGL